MTVRAEDRPLSDTHIHYSHDAWEIFPPEQAVALLQEAGLKRAFVSSSSDDGTQQLYRLAPELVVPVLRPYYRRGEISTWMQDPGRVAYLERRLAEYTYFGIGEFHAFGDDIETDVLRGTIELAKKHGLFLHAHSDSEAIRLIFEKDPDARVLWAHSGFVSPDEIRIMLEQYPGLWADLAFRSEHADGDTVDPRWKALFEGFPDRFMLGTDTYTPERWPFVVEHARWSRKWLLDLPTELAENIAWRNADRLLGKLVD
jgi:predicted TIM-barrel fold metal-dependent hydrolase